MLWQHATIYFNKSLGYKVIMPVINIGSVILSRAVGILIGLYLRRTLHRSFIYSAINSLSNNHHWFHLQVQTKPAEYL